MVLYRREMPGTALVVNAAATHKAAKAVSYLAHAALAHPLPHPVGVQLGLRTAGGEMPSIATRVGQCAAIENGCSTRADIVSQCN